MASINYREEGCVGLVTLNRPERRNALDMPALGELLNILKGAKKNRALGAIVFQGEGEIFSSGQDLGDETVAGPGADLGLALERGWNPVVEELGRLEKITLAAVNGTVCGAACSLALSCDLVVAAPKVKFIGGFSQLGLVPDSGCTALFIQGLGRHQALEFFLGLRTLSAEDLHQANLVNRLEENPKKEALALAQRVGKLSQEALVLTKKIVRHYADRHMEEYLKRETMAQRHLGTRPSYREGLRAFREKRSPVF